MTDQPMGGRAKPRRTTRHCPICRAPAVARWRPFCSSRCADADLAHWLAGTYRIAASEEEADADGAAEDDGSEADRE